MRLNGRQSSSPYVKDEIEKFSASEETNIRSISTKIQHGTYEFAPARGVAVSKPNKPGSVRPIVIPRAQDRVVQRCILNALMTEPKLKEAAFQPTSFGGVPKNQGQELSGVPAAIRAAMTAISAGGSHIAVADIASFFSNIRKSDASQLVSKHSSNPKFLDLFERAIAVDLDNHEEVWRFKEAFPYGDIGVGQGVCLSPFLGNLVLSEFDQEMNSGDCTCLRYVDDIIIIGPSGKAVSANLRRAEKLLKKKGMEFSAEKTSRAPIEVRQSFSFLGIEFNGEKLRPAPSSRSSIVQRAREVAAKSLQAIRSAQKPEDFNDDYAIPRTLSKISGMSRGWANHYRFCNDIETIRNVDRQLASLFLEYSAKADELAREAFSEKGADLAAKF